MSFSLNLSISLSNVVKVISFFCLDSCRVLSYDVEPGVPWRELCRRLEEDTLIVAKDQMLLTWNGDLLGHTRPTTPSRDVPFLNVADSHRRRESSECVGVVVGPACLAEDVWVPRFPLPSSKEAQGAEPPLGLLRAEEDPRGRCLLLADPEGRVEDHVRFEDGVEVSLSVEDHNFNCSFNHSKNFEDRNCLTVSIFLGN
jgi:hypothetical protein